MRVARDDLAAAWTRRLLVPGQSGAPLGGRLAAELELDSLLGRVRVVRVDVARRVHQAVVDGDRLPVELAVLDLGRLLFTAIPMAASLVMTW